LGCRESEDLAIQVCGSDGNVGLDVVYYGKRLDVQRQGSEKTKLLSCWSKFASS